MTVCIIRHSEMPLRYVYVIVHCLRVIIYMISPSVIPETPLEHEDRISGGRFMMESHVTAAWQVADSRVFI